MNTATIVAKEVQHRGQAYTIRSATPNDIPFLAWMQYEASLPPSNYSFWDYPLMGLGIETRAFIETVMRLEAGSWGSVDEFLILAQDGQPLAAAAGVEATPAFSEGPVKVSEIDRIGQALGWSTETTATYRERYVSAWPNPEGNFILLPQAPYIIESVAVVPELRGMGLVHPLMEAVLEEGRRRGHQRVGITVANGNVPAQRVYEQMGFQMFVSFGPGFFGEEGFLGYTKYVKAL
jgi:ribosomal protein S18 acetylase RimI-like enzyme